MSRNLLLPSPNLAYTPRGLPVNEHRLRNLTGLEFLGRFCSFKRASNLSSSDNDKSLIIASNFFLIFENFNTVSCRFKFLLIIEIFAISLMFEGEIKRLKQRTGFIIAFSSCRDGNIHTAQCIYFIVLDFRKNYLLFDSKVKITSTIE
jgi:hypothetical protein